MPRELVLIDHKSEFVTVGRPLVLAWDEVAYETWVHDYPELEKFQDYLQKGHPSRDRFYLTCRLSMTVPDCLLGKYAFYLFPRNTLVEALYRIRRKHNVGSFRCLLDDVSTVEWLELAWRETS